MARLILILLLLPFSLFSQKKTEILDSTGKAIAYFEHDLLKDETGRIWFTVKENLVFRGASEEKDKIFLLVKSGDLFSTEIGEVLDNTMKHTIYTINDGRFYLGSNAVMEDDGLLGFYDIDSAGQMKLFDGRNHMVLAKIKGPALTSGQLVALFYILDGKFKLQEQVEQRLQQDETEKPLEEQNLEQTHGTIKKLWDTGMEQFEWDGEILKRTWNSFDFEEWTFDGTSLKRAWYPGDEEFTWDGEVMQRRWYSSPDEFEWDGRILRRRWGSPRDEFIIQGNIVKRYLDSSGKDDWEIEGDIPIPVIALVVFHLLRK